MAEALSIEKLKMKAVEYKFADIFEVCVYVLILVTL